jgi:hypothetical protein
MWNSEKYTKNMRGKNFIDMEVRTLNGTVITAAAVMAQSTPSGGVINTNLTAT